jgi:REP element-mobilizing transposase RayT
MKKIDYFPPFKSNDFFHVYNQGNNCQKLLHTKENFEFFLRRYDYYLSPFVETYAFCILSNHFHLLIQVKDEVIIREFIAQKVQLLEKIDLLLDDEIRYCKILERLQHFSIPEIISKRFQALFTSIAKAINKQTGNTGSLFRKKLKRARVDNTCYFANLVWYIHRNPQYHRIIDDFRQYPWSSFNRIMISKPTSLNKKAVLDWFYNPENYLNYHAITPDLTEIKHLLIED